MKIQWYDQNAKQITAKLLCSEIIFSTAVSKVKKELWAFLLFVFKVRTRDSM